MSLRIGFHIPYAAPVDDPGVNSAIVLLRKNLELAKAPDTRIVFRVFEKGGLRFQGSFENACSSYLELYNGPALVAAIVESERAGMDAVIISCAHDPILKEARQAVNIPVVGLTQSSVLFSQLMGSAYGIISIAPQGKLIVEERIKTYGMDAHLVGMEVLETSLADQAMCMVAPTDIGVEDVCKAARKLIQKGAEVIYTACGGTSLMMRIASGLDAYPKGVTEVDGVPLIDQLSVAVKVAEMLVALKRVGSPWISRAGIYKRPSAEVLEMSGVSTPNLGRIWGD